MYIHCDYYINYILQHAVELILTWRDSFLESKTLRPCIPYYYYYHIH